MQILAIFTFQTQQTVESYISYTNILVIYCMDSEDCVERTILT